MPEQIAKFCPFVLRFGVLPIAMLCVRFLLLYPNSEGSCVVLAR